MLSVGSASHFMADLARMNFKTLSGFGGDIMVSVFFSYIIIPLSTFMLARGTGYFSTNFSSIRTSLSRQGEFLLWSIITGTYFFFSLRFILFQAKKQFDIKKRACAALPLRRYDVCLCGHAVPACPFSSFIRAARVQRSAFHRSPVFLPSFSGI